jgi:hypothetical protein
VAVGPVRLQQQAARAPAMVSARVHAQPAKAHAVTVAVLAAKVAVRALAAVKVVRAVTALAVPVRRAAMGASPHWIATNCRARKRR